ncbi:MAG TPA: formyltransferase family protein [Vicinamibacteria bacterium]|nr:formyltransferase family protein [Vicinamibacteria bacterium]
MTGPLRVALLCSQRAPGLRHLLTSDPNRGSLYEIVCCVSSEEDSSARAEAEARGVSFLNHSIARFCRERETKRTDLIVRSHYDTETVELLAPFEPDLILLSSYLLVLTEPMLDAFASRIVNVHGSDLAKRDASGRPRYVGLRAVRDALLAGETETRATAHLVTAVLDEGPILCRSRAFPVSPLVADALRRGAVDVVKAYTFAHQEWMLATAWGPLLSESIEMMSVREPACVVP